MVIPTRAQTKISLVLADVDGTLVTAETVLTSRARAAVKALQVDPRQRTPPAARTASGSGQNLPIALRKRW
jgi:phosphoglycolate phosphatase-like HAD superfamily hydrolase